MHHADEAEPESDEDCRGQEPVGVADRYSAAGLADLGDGEQGADEPCRTLNHLHAE
jgi:hypothetical protein